MMQSPFALALTNLIFEKNEATRSLVNEDKTNDINKIRDRFYGTRVWKCELSHLASGIKCDCGDLLGRGRVEKRASANRADPLQSEHQFICLWNITR